MYIKLGNITVNKSSKIDDFIIFMEVTDSTMSFERPVFIRNSEQLDIWFGKNFSSREYYRELLDRGGVTLYLYKPISEKIDSPDYIDLDTYQEYYEEVIFYSVYNLPLIPDLSIKYNVNGVYYVYVDDTVGYVLLSDIGKYIERPGKYSPLYQTKEFANFESLPKQGQPGFKYKVLESDLWYIWLEDSWVSEEELPQNLLNESVSLSNRDTLALTDPTVPNLPKYIYPEYKESGLSLPSEPLPGLSKIVIDSESGLAMYESGGLIDIDSEKLQEGTETLSLKMTYVGDNNGSLGDGIQLIQGIRTTENTVATRNAGTPEYNGTKLPADMYSKSVVVSSMTELKNIYQTCGYVVNQKGNDLHVYSGLKFDLTYLSTFKEILVQNDTDTVNKIMTQLFYNYTNFEMWSKTIGRDSDDFDEDKNIKVEIENIGTYKYRIRLYRYDYSESFEGSLYPVPGEDRLDDLISKKSNLVYCNIKGNTDQLRTGEFTLRGAKVETSDKNMYWKSLSVMTSEEFYPDYLLIPDLNKYVSGLNKNYSYYIEHKKFLEIAKELNCQVLIQNNDSPYKLKEVDTIPETLDDNTVYKIRGRYYLGGKEINDQYLISLVEAGNDFIFNYTEDSENRLVYFYRGMTKNLIDLPGYYTYIRGLLDDIYSFSPTDIVYDSPVTYPYDLDLNVIQVEELPKIPRTDTVYIIGTDYYIGSEKITDESTIASIEDEKTKELLKKYKSNYLVYNNQMYYYRGYENGEDYETTAWMRFSISKITRELLKNKWSYLSLRNIGKIREGIVTILSRIPRNFSVVRSIDIELFNPDLNENKLELTLNTSVADLVDNNIVLDLTINYNKEN